MGLYDRDYTRYQSSGHGGGMPQMRLSFPKITPIVKKLLIINVGIYLIGLIFFPQNNFVIVSGQRVPVDWLEKWFAVVPNSWPHIAEIWRLIGYQFLHSQSSPFHIFINMLALFFLGPVLERHWGPKKFLIFYLLCGAAGGLFYTFLAVIGFLAPGPMVGASGAILGMLAACAILFPQFVVFILFFPVPIRVAAVALTGLYLVAVITKGHNAGGDAAHLAGMATGAAYVFSQKWRGKIKMKIQANRWQKKIQQQKELQNQLDGILEKVHNQGIHSLTSKEKRILKKATREQQKNNQ